MYQFIEKLYRETTNGVQADEDSKYPMDAEKFELLSHLAEKGEELTTLTLSDIQAVGELMAYAEEGVQGMGLNQGFIQRVGWTIKNLASVAEVFQHISAESKHYVDNAVVEVKS